jgi:hypothetical protein
MEPGGDKQKLNLEMAEALDEMDKALSGENAEFLEKALVILRKGKLLNGKQEIKLEALYDRYFGEEAEQKEDDGNGDDIDEDDFV